MPKLEVVNANNVIEYNPQKANFKLKNTGGPKGEPGAQGPKGDTGPQGPAGPQGIQGDKGDRGAQGERGPQGIQGPQGEKGATGAQGPQGPTGATGATGAKGDKGDKGDAGAAATITVGSTTTTNPGTNATVTNSGTTSAAVLNFGIPKGATGSVKSEVVSELPETGEEDTFYLVNREATEQTATGKAINFTNSDNAGDITDFKLDGETSQNGTPTPSAPVPVQTVTGENVVKITGKNLLEFSNASNSDRSSFTYSVETPEMVVATKNTTGGKFIARYEAYFEAGKTYIFSLDEGAGRWIYIYSNRLWGTMVGRLRNENMTFTPTTSGTYVVGFYTDGAAGTTFELTNPIAELGSTATAYEPYQGQSYEVNLGKNLLDPSILEVGNITAQGVDSASTQVVRSDYIYLKAGNYALRVNDANNQIKIFRYVIYDTSKTFVSSSSPLAKQITITMSADGYLRLCFYNDPWRDITVDEIVASNIQLELGSQATSYAAYFTPIELCKIGDYQDYIYKSDGKWHVHKAIGELTLTGDDSEGWSSTGTNVFATTNGAITGSAYPPLALCRYATFNPVQSGVTGTLANGEFAVQYNNGSNSRVFFKNTAISDVSDFVAWVSENTPTIYYALVTPTDTEITNEALVGQLDNVASAPLYTGVNNITTITPNKQGTLEIKYVTYDKYNQNKVYIWNDTLQQWQIIVP